MKAIVILPLVLLLAFTGCGKKDTAKQGEAGKRPGREADVQQVLAQVDKLMQGEKRGEAVALLDKTMADETYAKDRGWLFSTLLHVLLSADDVAAAKERYLATIPEDVVGMRAGFGMVSRYYEANSDLDSLIEWTEVLMNSRLPKELEEQAFGYHLDVRFRLQQYGEILRIIPESVKRFDANGARRIVSDPVRKMLNAGRYDDCAAVLSAIDGLVEGADAVQALVTSLWIELAALRGQWAEVEERFRSDVAGLPDGDAAGCLQRVIQAAIRAGEDEVGNRLCEHVLTQLSGKPATTRTAAVQWMALAKKGGAIDKILSCFEALQKFGVDPRLIANLYGNYAYHVMTAGTKEQVAHMVAFGDSVLGSEIDDATKENVKGVMLDGAFIAEDYRRALRIIEEGLPDRSKEWHGMALNKVGAHLALQEGRNEDAVKAFREFMTYVAKEESKPQLDPTTGIEHSKEMILGRNAKRIGDILISMGKKDEGAAAYREASGYYTAALANLASDSESYKVVQSELSAVPSN